MQSQPNALQLFNQFYGDVIRVHTRFMCLDMQIGLQLGCNRIQANPNRIQKRAIGPTMSPKNWKMQNSFGEFSQTLAASAVDNVISVDCVGMCRRLTWRSWGHKY